METVTVNRVEYIGMCEYTLRLIERHPWCIELLNDIEQTITLLQNTASETVQVCDLQYTKIVMIFTQQKIRDKYNQQVLNCTFNPLRKG